MTTQQITRMRDRATSLRSKARKIRSRSARARKSGRTYDAAQLDATALHYESQADKLETRAAVESDAAASNYPRFELRAGFNDRDLPEVYA